MHAKMPACTQDIDNIRPPHAHFDNAVISRSSSGGGSVYFCAIPSSSLVQNELSLTTPNFSLFVLELPFPNRKAEVIFHRLFWNFRSQIEKRKLYFTIRFGTFAPKSKRES